MRTLDVELPNKTQTRRTAFFTISWDFLGFLPFSTFFFAQLYYLLCPSITNRFTPRTPSPRLSPRARVDPPTFANVRMFRGRLRSHPFKAAIGRPEDGVFRKEKYRLVFLEQRKHGCCRYESYAGTRRTGDRQQVTPGEGNEVRRGYVQIRWRECKGARRIKGSGEHGAR